MSFEKITCFFLSLLIKLKPQESPEQDCLLSLSHGLSAIVWEEQITPNGPPTLVAGEPEQAHSQTDTVSNVQPQHNIETVLPDHITKGEVSPSPSAK